MRHFFRLCIALFMSAFLAACGSSSSSVPDSIDRVAAQQGFNALLAAVEKAGLGGVLSNPDAQLTVFAPTDAAFGQLATSLGFADATAMVEALPAEALRDILSYHVLSGRKTASDLRAAGATQPTLYEFEGQPATLAIAAGEDVTITDAALTAANVIAADVAAGNSVVHAIDKVLVPPGVLNVVQMAQVNPLFDSLVQAVVAADLQGALAAPGPFTVFAPTNDAFAAAPTGLSTTQLTTVLTYHVLGSQVLSSGIPFGTPVPTLAQQSITINAGPPPAISDTTATPAGIVATDVRASNGVIHVIDKVLIPAL